MDFEENVCILAGECPAFFYVNLENVMMVRVWHHSEVGRLLCEFLRVTSYHRVLMQTLVEVFWHCSYSAGVGEMVTQLSFIGFIPDFNSCVLKGP